MKLKSLVILTVLVVSGGLLGVTGNEVLPEEPAVSYEWPVSAPEDQGLHSNIVDTALDAAGELPYLHGLLVVKNGYLVGERYFSGYTRDIADNFHSATKSVTSLLIGLALKEGYLTGVDQKVMDFFPEYATPDMDPRKYDITIRHLLTMTCGLGAYPGDNGLMTLRSPNIIEATLQQPVIETPGTVWNYYSPATQLLRGIIKKASGMSSYDFAYRYLFDPLQISVGFWNRDAAGYYTGYTEYTPRAMARIGDYCIKNGVVNGVETLPEGWIAESVRPLNIPDFPTGLHQNAYGYQWWVGQLAGYDVYAAMGWGGQNLICIPEIDMVVVTTGDWAVDVMVLTLQEPFILTFVEQYLLTAVRGVLGEPPYFPQDFTGRRVTVRGWFVSETMDLLTWMPNPRNAGLDIVKYRIYRYFGEERQLTAEVEHVMQDYEYRVRRVGKYDRHVYGVTAVTAAGEESLSARVIIEAPTRE